MSPAIEIGRNTIELDSTDSTNAVARRLLERGLEDGTVIVSRFQEEGRGQYGNRWYSEAGQNLLMSVVLQPAFVEPRHQFLLNQAASLAVADALSSILHPHEATIKWPNDILADGKKMAGLLIENTVVGNQIRHSIWGIGLNVNQDRFPVQAGRAASLRTVTGRSFQMNEILHSLCACLSRRYGQLAGQQIGQIQKDYMKQLFKLEEDQIYAAGGKRFVGRISGITASGKLLMHVSGKFEVFGFKEIEMVL